MNASQLFAAAHADARTAKYSYPGSTQTYRQRFAKALTERHYTRRQNAKIEAAKQAAIAAAATRAAEVAAQPVVLVTIALSFRQEIERNLAKKEGFAYNGNTKTWSKQMRRSQVPARLEAYVVARSNSVDAFGIALAESNNENYTFRY